MAAIYLGLSLPKGSSDQPGDRTGRPLPPIRSCSGWGLPGRQVTLPPVSSYLTISPLSPTLCRRRYVSVALSVGSPLPGVTRHPARTELGLSSPISKSERLPGLLGQFNYNSFILVTTFRMKRKRTINALQNEFKKLLRQIQNPAA